MKEHRLLHGSAWIVSGQFVSMAFQAAYFVLMGRTLGNSMINLGLLDACATAAHDLGYAPRPFADGIRAEAAALGLALPMSATTVPATIQENHA